MSTTIVEGAFRVRRLKNSDGSAGSNTFEGIADQGAGTCPEGVKGPGRPAVEARGQVVSCRLPGEELRAFDALCGQLGAGSRSDGVRSIIRMASGFLEFSREDSTRLEDILYEIGKIGANVNQIALAANRGRAPLVRAQWTAIEDLRRALPAVRRTLAEVVSEQRRQGVSLFRRYAEGEGFFRG